MVATSIHESVAHQFILYLLVKVRQSGYVAFYLLLKNKFIYRTNQIKFIKWNKNANLGSDFQMGKGSNSETIINIQNECKIVYQLY